MEEDEELFGSPSSAIFNPDTTLLNTKKDVNLPEFLVIDKTQINFKEKIGSGGSSSI